MFNEHRLYIFPKMAYTLIPSRTAVVCGRKSSRCSAEDLSNRTNLMLKARRNALKMAIWIPLAFMVCWTPYAVIVIWYQIAAKSAEQMRPLLQQLLFMFVVLNSVVNPLVHSRHVLLSSAFCRRLRQVGKNHLGIHTGGSQPPTNSQQNSVGPIVMRSVKAGRRCAGPLQSLLRVRKIRKIRLGAPPPTPAMVDSPEASQLHSKLLPLSLSQPSATEPLATVQSPTTNESASALGRANAKKLSNLVDIQLRLQRKRIKVSF